MSDAARDAERALIEAAARGDEAAAKRLSDRLAPVITARVRRLLARQRKLGPNDLQDLVSEVWLSLFDDDWRRLRSYQPDKGASLEGYVGLIAEREAINRLEHLATQKRGGGIEHTGDEAAHNVPSIDPDPEQVSSAHELATALDKHLWAELPERGRMVLRYLYHDGRDVTEVATILAVQAQVVYNWQHKIRQLARTFIGEES